MQQSKTSCGLCLVRLSASFLAFTHRFFKLLFHTDSYSEKRNAFRFSLLT